jgi:hypothetical protein
MTTYRSTNFMTRYLSAASIRVPQWPGPPKRRRRQWQLAAFEQVRQRAIEICRQRAHVKRPTVLDWLMAERELNARAYTVARRGYPIKKQR